MNNELSVNDVARLLSMVLQEFREKIDPEVPAQRLLTLLTVAANPDVPQFDVAKHVKGITAATVSRNVTDLSTLDRFRKPGPGLLEQLPDPMWRRRNLLRLTPKGESLLEGITKKVNKELSRKSGRH